MTNLEKYNKAFIEALGVTEAQLPELQYQGIEAWDSVGHMTLVSTLENAFDIMLDTIDVIGLSSYEEGKKILAKDEYGVKF